MHDRDDIVIGSIYVYIQYLTSYVTSCM